MYSSVRTWLLPAATPSVRANERMVMTRPRKTNASLREINILGTTVVEQGGLGYYRRQFMSI